MANQTAAYIDEVSVNGASGWISRTGLDNSFPEVRLRVNGVEKCALKHTTERKDVTTFLGREAMGVYCKLVRYLENGQNRIEIYYACNGELLPNGLWNLDFDRDQLTAAHWSKSYSENLPIYIRWWQSDYLVRKINQRLCGESVPGVSQGLYRLVRKIYPEAIPATRAVSVGAGYGAKEIEALQFGLATHFDLFEVSKQAIERGQLLAQENGVSEAMNFRLEDAFEAVLGEGIYDLVFWNNSLHHMADTRAAIEWSYRVLKPGGIFVMDDFVGATRMQYPDEMLEISSAYRRSLPERYLRNPLDPDGPLLSTQCVRPDIDDLIYEDPSECVDSGNILRSLNATFPRATVIPTGGGVYHLGLSDVLHNIMAAEDNAEIDRAFAYDDHCLASGMTHYAVAVARKE